MYSQNEPPQTRTPGARCAVHVEEPASSVCSRCGAYACVQCSRVGSEGLDYCQACIAKVAAPALATRNSRLLAHFLDSIVVSIPVLVAMVIFTVLMLMVGKGADADTRGLMGGLMGLLTLLMVLGMLGYQAYLLTRTGQSIGKRMMGIRVVRGDGSQADFVRVVLLRNVVPYLIGAGCGLFTIIDLLFIFAEDQRCLHDHISDTRVVKVDEKSPPSFG